ncbi:MAG: hypothetical protein WA102_05260 [Candidatus Methanoperedens sp.]
MKKLKLVIIICLFILIGTAAYLYTNKTSMQQHDKNNISVQPIPTVQKPEQTFRKPIPNVGIDAEPYNPQISRGNSVRVKIIVGGANVTKGDEIYFDYTVRLRYPNGTSIDNPSGINLSFNPLSVVFPETYNEVSPYILYSNLTITVMEIAPNGDYQIYFGRARNESLTVASQTILFSLK